MKKYLAWYFKQKKIKRFFISLTINSSVFIIIWLMINTLTGEPWYSGMLGGFAVAVIFSYWSLNDKQFYDHQQKRKARNENN